MMTATLVRELPDFSGFAALYALDQPLPSKDYMGNERTSTHVAVVATAPYGRPAVFVYPADAEGNVIDWMDATNTAWGYFSHAEALSSLGYEVALGSREEASNA